MVLMARKDQKSVTIPLAEWEMAEREAEKEGKKPTTWIRDLIKEALEQVEPLGVQQV